MSYCRWSSDDFQCDVYVYESECGWVVHVARRRRIIPATVRAGLPTEPVSRFVALMDWMDAHPEQWVSLEHLDGAGQSFDTETPGECADILAGLQGRGFRVPDGVIAALRAEATT